MGIRATEMINPFAWLTSFLSYFNSPLFNTSSPMLSEHYIKNLNLCLDSMKNLSLEKVPRSLEDIREKLLATTDIPKLQHSLTRAS